MEAWMALTVPALSRPDPTPHLRRRRLLAVLAAHAAVAVAVAAAAGTWIATRSHGSHHALPDMCAAVAAVEGVAVVPGLEPSSCAWTAGTTSFTLAATLYGRTRWHGAGERADDAFRYEQGGAVDRAADGSGWPHAYRAMPGTADAAFCLGQYDGAEHFVTCTVRDGNVILELAATWNDPSSALRLATVEQALTTFAPRAQRLLTGVVDQL
jgi:hypothetical protein